MPLPNISEPFTPTQDHLSFRTQLKALLASPEFIRVLATQQGSEDFDPAPAHRILGEKRWLAPNWPEEYGGLGVDSYYAAIVTEELALHQVPDSAYVNTIRNAGATLLAVGTQEQRHRYLPGLAQGRELMSILYTEPSVGSDLASLETLASPSRLGWLLNGEKVYSVKCAFSKYAIVAVRTRETRIAIAGISTFIVDLDSPGVTIQKIPTINPEPFYCVKFENVFVGPDQLLGDLHGGWQAMDSALCLERVGIDYSARAQAWYSILTNDKDPQATESETVGVSGYPVLRYEVDCGRALAWDMVGRLEQGRLSSDEAAVSKLYNSELLPEIVRRSYASGDEDSPLMHANENALDRCVAEAPGLVLSAGTSEMMQYVISSTLDYAVENPISLAEAYHVLAEPGEALLAKVDSAESLGAAGVHPGELMSTLWRGIMAQCDISAKPVGAGSTFTTPTTTAPHHESGRFLALSFGGDIVMEPRLIALTEMNEGVKAVILNLDQALDQPVVAVSRSRRERYIDFQPLEPLKCVSAEMPLSDCETTQFARSAGAIWIAYLLGVARGSLSACTERVSQRYTFGSEVLGNQSVQFRLATEYAHLRAARSGIAGIAQSVDGASSGTSTALLQCAWRHAGRVARRATELSIHLSGAHGLVEDNPLSEMYYIAHRLSPQLLTLA